PLDSYFVSCAFWSATISIWTFLRVPVEPPHQFGTASKSADCLGVRAVILNCPVPMIVAGSIHHLLSPTDSTTFLSTTQAVQRATSVNQYPAGATSVAENEKSSIFLRPVIWVALPAATSSYPA